MKKSILLGSALLLTACSGGVNREVSVYQGELPCADCEKIQAELRLNRDKSYQFNTIYFKNAKAYAFSESGTVVADSQKPGIIRLPNSDNLTLKLGENYVELCDSQGNTLPQRHHYRLKRVK